MKRTKRNHGAIFKAHVAAAASKGDKTLSELAVQCSVHSTRLRSLAQWAHLARMSSS